MGSYFKRPKSSAVASVGLQLVLLRTVYSQVQGCVCTALQLGGDVEQHWLMSKHDVINKTGSITTPPEEDRATAIGNMHKTFGEDRTCSCDDMIADRQTHTDSRRSSQYSAPLSGRSKKNRGRRRYETSLNINARQEVRLQHCTRWLLA